MDKKTLERANNIATEITELSNLADFLDMIDGAWAIHPHIDVNSYVMDPIHTSLKIRTKGTRDVFNQFSSMLRRRIYELNKELKNM